MKDASSALPNSTTTPPAAAGPLPVGTTFCVVTVTPKYDASHLAVCTSLPPLSSITCVTTCLGMRPPSVERNPTMVVSCDQRPDASVPLPLASKNVTGAFSAMAASAGNTFCTKCCNDWKLLSCAYSQYAPQR